MNKKSSFIPSVRFSGFWCRARGADHYCGRSSRILYSILQQVHCRRSLCKVFTFLIFSLLKNFTNRDNNASEPWYIFPNSVKFDIHNVVYRVLRVFLSREMVHRTQYYMYAASGAYLLPRMRSSGLCTKDRHNADTFTYRNSISRNTEKDDEGWTWGGGGNRTDTAVFEECRNEMIDRMARCRFDLPFEFEQLLSVSG